MTGASAASIKAEATATKSAAPPIVERLLIALTPFLRATEPVAASTQNETLPLPSDLGKCRRSHPEAVTFGLW